MAIENKELQMPPAQKVLVILSCGHVMMGNGYTREMQCFKDQKVFPVVDYHTHEWYTKCTTCNYARWHGLSEGLASQDATQHTNTKGHVCKYDYMPNPFAVYMRKRMLKNVGTK